MHPNQRYEALCVNEVYITAASLHDMPDNGILCVRVLGRSLLLAGVDGHVHVLHNLCSHAHGSFERGRLRGHVITCPHHGARFDVRDGRCLGGPADQPIDHYPSRIRDGMIEVCLPEDGGDASGQHPVSHNAG
jgi:nitrite reductase/ring-hydroxylating ferredoxin subunit